MTKTYEKLGISKERYAELTVIGGEITATILMNKNSGKSDIIQEIINRDDLVEVEKAYLLFSTGEFIRDMENKMKFMG